MSEYEIGAAFSAIETELIESMMRNLKRHRAQETEEGFQWGQWQAEQLDALEEYRRRNRDRFGSRFDHINSKLQEAISNAHADGGASQEEAMLQAVAQGASARKRQESLGGSFFQVNERKLNALVDATTKDMEQAEQAVLRKANDEYRKIIFNAQVYANSGAGTYEKAVDMATRDFLMRGIQCIEYRNGARHTIADYADMALKTVSKRAYLQGEGQKRQEWSISTVIINKRGNACPECARFAGKIFIDDVWSGGKAADGPYPLLSSAIKQGLYHPRYKDSHTTYFPELYEGNDESVTPFTRQEIEGLQRQETAESRKQFAQRQAEKYQRLANFMLDPQNQQRYQEQAKQWVQQAENAPYLSKAQEIFTKAKQEYGDSATLMAKRPFNDHTQKITDELASLMDDFRPLSEQNAMKELMKAAREWERKLLPAERKVIVRYTGSPSEKRPKFYERLNAMLYGTGESTQALENSSNEISRGILKFDLKHDILCYRASDIDMASSYSVGDVFPFKAFVSTSVSPNATLRGKYGVIIFTRKSGRCAYLKNLSKYAGQEEVLFHKLELARVLKKEDNTVWIEMI